MKKVLMVLVLSFMACKSTEETTVTKQNELLLQYSKGPCLGGKCPVYDFLIYPNGDFVFKNVKGIESDKEIKGRLPSKKIKQLKALLQKLKAPTNFKRIRDLPVSTLKFNGKSYKYHANKTQGELKDVNTLVETLVLGIRE